MALAWESLEVDDGQTDLARCLWIAGAARGPTLAERVGRCRPAWFTQAACRGMDPELFYPAAGESTAEAHAVCDGCPVRERCGALGLANHEQFGIWGGLTRTDRRRAAGAVGQPGA